MKREYGRIDEYYRHQSAYTTLVKYYARKLKLFQPNA